MPYEKGSYIYGFKVSLLLKQSEETETYRVRDVQGKLCVLKYGVSASELDFAPHSDLFLTKGNNYVVYRYINGETLETRMLRLKKLGEAETIEFAKGILKRLTCIHLNGMAHLNLTIDNIVVELGGESPVPYIVGYGQMQPVSQTGIYKDLCAVGSLMCKMLTGESSEKIKVNVGKLSFAETVMMKALYSEFKTADEMICALEGSSPILFSPKSKVSGFSLVAGMDSLKDKLKSEVIDILSDREGAEKYGIIIPNGMLLYGPPGCGKTFISERFAEEAGYNYRYVKSSDLASTYLHGSQEKIAELFDDARKNSPTILCFDEFDALVPKRDVINNASQSAEVNEFLSQLNNCGKDGVFVIATTNRPDKIDSAVLRSGRIDYKIFVPMPDFESRIAIFQISLKDRPVEDDIDYKKLAKITDGYLASDISAIVQMAAREAFRLKLKITFQMILKATKATLPSLSKSQIKEYEKMRIEFELRNNDDGRKRVGFVNLP